MTFTGSCIEENEEYAFPQIQPSTIVANCFYKLLMLKKALKIEVTLCDENLYLKRKSPFVMEHYQQGVPECKTNFPEFLSMGKTFCIWV